MAFCLVDRADSTETTVHVPWGSGTLRTSRLIVPLILAPTPGIWACAEVAHNNALQAAANDRQNIVFPLKAIATQSGHWLSAHWLGGSGRAVHRCRSCRNCRVGHAD